MASLCRRFAVTRGWCVWRKRALSPAVVGSRAIPYSTNKEIDEGLRLGDYPVLPWRSAQEEKPTACSSPHQSQPHVNFMSSTGFTYRDNVRGCMSAHVPFLGWWDDQDRRDKETPLHEEDDALNMWMYDAIENNGKYTRWQALGQLAVAFGLLGGLYYLSVLYDAPSRNPAVPRQFPYDNLYLERGGDPSKPPDPTGKVKATYGEFTA